MQECGCLRTKKKQNEDGDQRTFAYRTMNTILRTTLPFITALLAGSSNAGEITGSVTFKGMPPPEITADLKSHPALEVMKGSFLGVILRIDCRPRKWPRESHETK